LLYLATSPHLFPVICEQLGAAGLNGPNVRVVLEKPLGHDLASAQEINRVVRAAFAESQALRIDHYLGKPAVQNLMALRFGNALFEPLWRRESIANIQITMAESLGVGTRGDYYDSTGALRDMIQNHALQLLTMIAMEPPSSSDADAIRDEKLKVLKSLKPFTPETVARDVVRGQYRAGTVDGKAVPGYLDEIKVPAGSRCETFVALRTEVQNWRWAGVPFYLRTGKRLARATRRSSSTSARCRTRSSRHAARQQAGHQAAARRRPGAAPAGGQGQRQQRAALAGVARPGLRQGLPERTRGRLRAPAARRHRRPAEPLRAQRRAGAGLALGDADPGRLGRDDPSGRDPTPPAAGARPPPAHWWRATAAPGPRNSDARPGRHIVLDRIRASIPALPPAEQRVARLVLADPRSFASLPVGELAERSRQQADRGALLPQRRLRRPGRLQAQARRQRQRRCALRAPRGGRRRQGRRHRRQGDRQRRGGTAEVPQRRRRHAVEQAIARTCRSRAHGPRIEFYGVGNSGIVAQDAQHKFFRLGVHAAAISDGHVQVMSATMLARATAR
jgi:hypothetical protein